MFRMKTFSILCAASALALATGAVNAAQLDVTSVVAKWVSATGGNNVKFDPKGWEGPKETATVSWGLGGGTQSGYVFSGIAPSGPWDAEEKFDLGTFIHNNYPINSGSSITSATLEVTFSFYLDGNKDEKYTRNSWFLFDHWETPNSDRPCANGGANNKGINGNGCADRVMVSTLAEYAETFTLLDADGVEREYAFAVSGFDIGDEFWTRENASNKAGLKAYYTYAENLIAPAPIPLPAAGWLLMGGLGALGVARRRRKAA